MDASRARLLIGDQAYEQMLNANDSAAIFRVPIRPGETRLQAFLYRADNAEIGAYFVNATRVVEEREELNHLRIRTCPARKTQPVVTHSRPVPGAVNAVPVKCKLTTQDLDQVIRDDA